MSPNPERASTSPLGPLQRNISTAVGSVVKRCWSMKRSLMWWLARPSFVVSIGAACLRLTAQDVTVRPWNTSSKSNSPPKGRLLDGSKPAIESTAVCNATGLTPAPYGLAYPPTSIDDLPSVMRPRAEGGQLHHTGQVEVVSSLERDGQPLPYDIRFGVWVVFEGDTEYIRRCFTEYGVRTDPSGRYACLYKRWHLIGLEVGISVAAVGVRHEPTGCPTGFRADAVATAKRDLKPGEFLDGEGGYTVVGRLMRAADSLAAGALPLGLAHGWKLTKPLAAGELVRWADVEIDATNSAVRLRQEMEKIGAARLETTR